MKPTERGWLDGLVGRQDPPSYMFVYQQTEWFDGYIRGRRFRVGLVVVALLMGFLWLGHLDYEAEMLAGGGTS